MDSKGIMTIGVILVVIFGLYVLTVPSTDSSSLRGPTATASIAAAAPSTPATENLLPSMEESQRYSFFYLDGKSVTVLEDRSPDSRNVRFTASGEGASDRDIIVFVPKSEASSASEIQVLGPNEVLQDDPVFSVKSGTVLKFKNPVQQASIANLVVSPEFSEAIRGNAKWSSKWNSLLVDLSALPFDDVGVLAPVLTEILADSTLSVEDRLDRSSDAISKIRSDGPASLVGLLPPHVTFSRASTSPSGYELSGMPPQGPIASIDSSIYLTNLLPLGRYYLGDVPSSKNLLMKIEGSIPGIGPVSSYSKLFEEGGSAYLDLDLMPVNARLAELFRVSSKPTQIDVTVTIVDPETDPNEPVLSRILTLNYDSLNPAFDYVLKSDKSELVSLPGIRGAEFTDSHDLIFSDCKSLQSHVSDMLDAAVSEYISSDLSAMQYSDSAFLIFSKNYQLKYSLDSRFSYSVLETESASCVLDSKTVPSLSSGTAKLDSGTFDGLKFEITYSGNSEPTVDLVGVPSTTPLADYYSETSTMFRSGGLPPGVGTADPSVQIFPPDFIADESIETSTSDVQIV